MTQFGEVRNQRFSERESLAALNVPKASLLHAKDQVSTLTVFRLVSEKQP